MDFTGGTAFNLVMIYVLQIVKSMQTDTSLCKFMQIVKYANLCIKYANSHLGT
jgi:hypothetical protein